MAVGVLSSQKLDPVAGTYSAAFTADGTPAASSIFCGFTPRVVKLTQIVGTPDATAQALWHEAMTSAYNVKITNAGTLTIPTTNGVTPLTGTEASPAAKATNSPAASGKGFTLGTGVQAANIVYLVEAYR